MRHEGVRLALYECPAGKWTIGAGRNLEDNGISHAEAMMMLANDIARCRQEVQSAFPWSMALPRAAQDVLVNMAFNMGIGKLRGFTKMLLSLRAHNYTTAADEMLDSKWAEQVGKRATELADTVRSLAAPDVG